MPMKASAVEAKPDARTVPSAAATFNSAVHHRPRCSAPSTATIDLTAINHNLAQVRDLVGDRKVLMAVKGDAYGHGAVQVARHVQQTGAADWLGVATVAEAQELVEAGVRLPILKFSPADPGNLETAILYGVRLTVVDERTVRQANEVAQAMGRCANVHVAIDTGMGRIGLQPEHLADVVAAVDRADHLRLEGVFTHLPVSDAPDGREFTAAEIAHFVDTVQMVEARRGHIPVVHMANSGAIIGQSLGPTTMVRAGIMSYGYSPNPVMGSLGLQPALSWTSHISFLKQVDPGQTVGYGRTWTARRRTTIATVPVGYADGYSRRLSNRGHVLIGGEFRPVVGRVCMDQLMVDLGPSSTARVGDDVVLLGEQAGHTITADDLAEQLDTISYEITCDIGKRVDRRWVS
ncbi:alanine racemase [Cutibacterium granulosum]|uniref:alanine racemase n=1 Tax=Cutibacterium granulosum TaxID=33011 RepID=UPI0023F9E0E0|nr:alanine racemase [Cutibacterium granulosum]